MELFHIEIVQLKEIFKEIFEKNGYDNKFFDKCLRTFLNKIYSKKVLQHTVPKKDLYIFLPYLEKLSLSARSTLGKTIRDILPCANLKVVNLKVLNLPSKTKYQKKCVPYFATSFSVVAAMLLIMVKPNATLRFVYLDIWESLHVHIKTSSLPKILLCVIIWYFVITLFFEDFSVLATGTNDFRIKLQESLLYIVMGHSETKHLSHPL